MLLRLDVPQEVGGDYKKFGVLLLNDKAGKKVKAMKMECLGDPEGVVQSILQEWLLGRGLPVTWETLIETLRSTNLSDFADKVQAEIPKL